MADEPDDDVSQSSSSSSPTKPGQLVRAARPQPRSLRVRASADGLTPRQKHAVHALLQEPTIGRAAVLAGVNEKTLRRWMELPQFQRAYHAARRSAFGQAIGLMQRYSPLAVTTLVQVMTD